MSNKISSYQIKGDKAIWFVLFFMSVVSIIWVYSASGKLGLQKTEFYLFKQTMVIIVGWIVAIIASQKLTESHIKKIAFWGYLIIIPTLILNLFIDSRWFQIPIVNITVQFSEIAKFATIITTAMLLTVFGEEVKTKKGFIRLLIPTVIISALVVKLSGSAAILIFLSNVLLIYMGRARIKHLLVLAGIAVVGILMFVLVVKAFPSLKEHKSIGRWEGRITSYFLSKEEKKKDELGGSYQISQSKMAIAEGKLFGKGVGKSTCRYFLPEAYNDFIFSIIVEEAGSLFGLVVLSSYLILLFRAISIFLKTENLFSRFVVLGLSVSIVMQAMLNISVVVGLVPVTGQTLPLISQGGTSIVVTFFGFGIIQAITAQEDQKKKAKIKTSEA
ncbi:MAG: hypothetical protein CSA94_00415 [Bacteroidetes bacterium]|nr:MAG: hypothetical protein CSA94_00415 [Bacteroidota bacterium]